MNMQKLSGLAVAIALTILAAVPAKAASTEILMQEKASFKDCIKIVDKILLDLQADPIQLKTVSHSSALYKVKFLSVDADLVFLCNDVTEVIEVRRITPGHWQQARTLNQNSLN